MKKPIQISITTPCDENWDAMTPVDKGRFCGSCQKSVYDFTNSSDREIAEAYKKDKNICGLFLDSQLNRDLAVPKERNNFWIAASAAAISLFASIPEASAQQKALTEQGTNKILGDTKVSHAKRFVSGIVTDKHNFPLADILVKNKSIEVYTDKNGNFTIQAQKGDEIELSGHNKKKYKFRLTEKTQYKVVMKYIKKPNPTRTMGRLF